jgi:predicted DNA-binding transcriptional regulator AlpA
MRLPTRAGGNAEPNGNLYAAASFDRIAHLPAEIAQHRVLDTAEAAAFCNFSVSHWRRLYRVGRVPTPIRLSARKLGWPIRDLVEWLKGRRTGAEHGGLNPAPKQRLRDRLQPPRGHVLELRVSKSVYIVFFVSSTQMGYLDAGL